MDQGPARAGDWWTQGTPYYMGDKQISKAGKKVGQHVSNKNWPLSNVFENISICRRKPCTVVGQQLGGKFSNMGPKERDDKTTKLTFDILMEILYYTILRTQTIEIDI